MVPDEGESLLSPPYVAVMVSEPTGRAVVVKPANPLDRVTLPRDVDPTENVTVPPARFGVSVAVNVTAAPYGVVPVADDLNATVGVALFTVWVMAADAAGL